MRKIRRIRVNFKSFMTSIKMISRAAIQMPVGSSSKVLWKQPKLYWIMRMRHRQM